MKVVKIFIGLSAMLAGAAKAQVQVPGLFQNRIDSPSLHKSGLNIRQYDLPPQNNEELLNAALAQEHEAALVAARKTTYENDGNLEIGYSAGKIPKAIPFKFGKTIPLSLDIDNNDHGEWIVDETVGTRMWRFKVKSNGAYSLSIYFSKFKLAPGSELYIIGEQETHGAFTAELNNKVDGLFGVAPVAGDYLILEYIEPLDSPHYKSSIVVSHMVHGFRPNPFTSNDLKALSGSCHVNVACPAGHGKAELINSVALMITGQGDSFCSGAMVNNVKGDGRQLFLTAEHCIGNSTVTNFMLGFNYQYRYCNSIFEGRPRTLTAHGMRLLRSAKNSDYALLEVIERIPDDYGVYLAGFDATKGARRQGSFFGIHHPSGDVKKISTFTGPIEQLRIIDAGNSPNYWRVSAWATGATEPGSSGSPLFDSHGYIIGHLLGGESSCSNTQGSDYYGAVDKDWNNSPPLSADLDPAKTGTLKVKGAYLRDIRKSIANGSDAEDDVYNSSSSLASSATALISKPGSSMQPTTVTVTQPPVTIVVTTTKTHIYVSTSTLTQNHYITVTQTGPRIVRTVTVTSSIAAKAMQSTPRFILLPIGGDGNI
jgi:hypothetical protein